MLWNCLSQHHFIGASVVIFIGIFSQLPFSDLIRLTVPNLIRILLFNLTHLFRFDLIWFSFSDSIQLPFYNFSLIQVTSFKSYNQSYNWVTPLGFSQRLECPDKNWKAKLWNISKFWKPELLWQGPSIFSKNKKKETNISNILSIIIEIHPKAQLSTYCQSSLRFIPELNNQYVVNPN